MDLLTEIQTYLKKGKIVKTKKKPKKVNLQPVYNTLILTGLTIATIGIATLSIKAYNWKKTHEFINPITWNGFVKEIKIEEKAVEYPNKPVFDTPIEEYICSKFDPYDCKIAVNIARAESGLREDAWNYNTDGTLDIGIFQINSVHWNRNGCSLKEITDPYKNVDCAYSIYLEQGFTPWVSYNSGAYLSMGE